MAVAPALQTVCGLPVALAAAPPGASKHLAVPAVGVEPDTMKALASAAAAGPGAAQADAGDSARLVELLPGLLRLAVSRGLVQDSMCECAVVGLVVGGLRGELALVADCVDFFSAVDPGLVEDPLEYCAAIGCVVEGPVDEPVPVGGCLGSFVVAACARQAALQARYVPGGAATFLLRVCRVATVSRCPGVEDAF